MAPWFRDGSLHFAVGIEDTFVPQEGVGRRKLDEYELTQHYHQWKDDLSRAADAGAGMIRWGIPWYLVEPSPGTFDWEWTDRVVAHLSDLGLRCMVDLMHYGTPLWLDNQFLNHRYPDAVAAYAEAAAVRYRGVLDCWTPLNEPIINAVYCGEQGTWPPYLRGEDGFVKIVTQLAKGMVLTQQRIAAAQPEATFVHVDAGFRWTGQWPAGAREHLEERRFLGLDLITGRVDADHPMRDHLTAHGVTEAELAWFTENAVTPDVIGVNYYPAFTTAHRNAGTGELTPEEAGTDGLVDLLHTYATRYEQPLFLSETSRGGSVEERLAWLEESVALVHRLREEGMPLVGYTWFPFFALVDWLYRESTEPVDRWLVQMGLYDLKRDAGAILRREPTALVDRFRALAKDAQAKEAQTNDAQAKEAQTKEAQAPAPTDGTQTS
ncbi:family 1 glycosylhydrolase [Streptomyces odontomachi]|uniref:family 1 glycosylhydrolase n=1 Tax=Streptomyces odontomachi TaxID=2944940 RepID=UPI00210BAA1F|nr:family 1 glycosylhydrolase [Streptomyces sp. ODS25]